MSDPADRVALWGTIGTWLSHVYGPVVASFWNYMKGFVFDRIIAFRKKPAQDVDLEAGLPLSNEVSKLSTVIERLGHHRVAQHDAILKMLQQLPEEISKQLAKAERRATIPTILRGHCDGCHCQAQQSGSRN